MTATKRTMVTVSLVGDGGPRSLPGFLAQCLREAVHRPDTVAWIAIATRSRLLRLACAVAVTCTVPGCITYNVTKNRSTYRELAISTSLVALEVGAGVLGGYSVHEDKVANADGASLGENVLVMTGCVFAIDAIIALGLYIGKISDE